MTTQPGEPSAGGSTGTPGPGQPPGTAESAIDVDLEQFAESPVVEVGRTLRLRQEAVRGILAIRFGIIFAGVVGLPIWFIYTWSEAQEWLQFTLPAVTGLLGSAMGFYFGQRNNGS